MSTNNKCPIVQERLKETLARIDERVRNYKEEIRLKNLAYSLCQKISGDFK